MFDLRLPILLAVLSSSALAADSNAGLEQANAAYRDHRSIDAVQLYRQYLESHSDRADVRIFLGAALLNLNRLPEALSETRRAITLDPTAGRAYTLAGRVYTAQRQWAAAQDHFAKAAFLNPSDRENAYFSARAFYDASQFETAVKQFAKAIDLGARESRVYANLGRSYEALNEWDKADHAYRMAVSSSDAGADAFHAYGLFLYRQNRLAESEAVLKYAFSNAPHNPEIAFAFARTLYRARKQQAAEQTLVGVLPSSDCRVHQLLLKIHVSAQRKERISTETQALENCGERLP